MADRELFANNARSTLASGITSGASSLTVASGEGARFPSPAANEFFWLTIIDEEGAFEIVKVTARSGDTMTITRAQQGTSAAAFDVGSTVSHRPTKDTQGRFVQKNANDTITGTLTVPTPTAAGHAARKDYVDTAVAAKANIASPTFTGTPTGPTASTGTNNTQLATTAYVVSRIANDAPTKSGSGATGTWPINITGTAAGSPSTSINTKTGAVTLAGSTDLEGSLGIVVSTVGQTITIQRRRPSGSDSIHPDSLVETPDGGSMFLRDVRVGDMVLGAAGPAEVLGIWTSILRDRELWEVCTEVGATVCTPGHLFRCIDHEGVLRWCAPDPTQYWERSHNRRRVVKGRRGLIETCCQIAESPENTMPIRPGLRILCSDGQYRPVTSLRSVSPGIVDGPTVADTQQMIALLLEGSRIFFADGHAVATLA